MKVMKKKAGVKVMKKKAAMNMIKKTATSEKRIEDCDQKLRKIGVPSRS